MTLLRLKAASAFPCNQMARFILGAWRVEVIFLRQLINVLLLCFDR